MSDVSSVTSHFPTVNEGFITTVAGSNVSSGGTIVQLASVSGLTNGTVFVGIIEPGLPNQQVFTGIVDTGGSQITGVEWTRGTNTPHVIGTTVVDYVTGTAMNMMNKGIQVEHNQDGTHKDAVVATLKTAILGVVYPIGSIYTNATSATNPSSLLGFGTWTAFGSGRVMVGVDAGQTEFDTLGETGGTKTSNHAFMSPPINSNLSQDGGNNYLNSANTDIDTWLTSGGSSVASRTLTIRNLGGTIRTSGTGGTEVGHYRYTAPTLQPYITVYMWKRTA